VEDKCSVKTVALESLIYFLKNKSREKQRENYDCKKAVKMQAT